MIAIVNIVVSKKGYYFRCKLGRVKIRSQLDYRTVKQCKDALKKLSEDLQITYTEEGS